MIRLLCLILSCSLLIQSLTATRSLWNRIPPTNVASHTTYVLWQCAEHIPSAPLRGLAFLSCGPIGLAVGMGFAKWQSHAKLHRFC